MSPRRLAPRRWADWPWAVKLAVLLVVVAIVPLMVMTLVGERAARREVLEQTRARLLQRAENTASLLDGYLDGVLADITALSRLPVTVEVLTRPHSTARRDELRRTLHALRNAKHLESLSILDDHGDVVVSTEAALESLNRMGTPAFLWASAGHPRVHDPRYVAEDDEVQIHASVPVYDTGGRVAGVARTRISLAEIDRLVKADSGFGGLPEFGLLWDERGIVLSSPAAPERRFRPLAALDEPTRGRLIAEGRFGPDTAALIAGSSGGESLIALSRWRRYDPSVAPFDEVDLGGGPLQAAAVPVGGRRWTYAVLVPTEHVVSAIRVESRRNLLAAFGSSLLALLLAVAAARRLSQPLSRVRDAARALAAGDLTRRAALSRRDEIGQMAAAFDQMADALAAQDAELRRHAESLERRVHERTLELQQSEERMRWLYRELQESSRLKDEFLGVVSHELRTPLNALLGWIQVLRRGGLDAPNADKALEAVERNGRAQAKLVEDLLDTSRAISGKLHLTPAPTDVRAVVEQAVDSFRPLATARGITLSLAAGTPLPLIEADAGRLQQVVGNLLANAVKFTPHGGRVHVSATAAGGAIEIRVTDSGIGIAEDFLPFVFDRFRQADSTTTRAHGGLGIGLAVARHLVELHGGTIRAESAGENAGATFVVSLPALAPVSHGTGDGPPTLPASLTGIDVLVVDDDADSRELLQAAFAEAGARVTVAESADAALNALRTRRPDVLLSDIGLPGRDGYALVEQVREYERAGRLPPVLAVAVSAYARDEDYARSAGAGFDRHVAKPVDSAAVVAIVADLLRERAGLAG
ncbi:MAG TPA: ATP-binding protein [Vicinamibacterales bacterium]|nr:ATP-binding protein [Vicinamibacterales bacterium]